MAEEGVVVVQPQKIEGPLALRSGSLCEEIGKGLGGSGAARKEVGDSVESLAGPGQGVGAESREGERGSTARRSRQVRERCLKGELPEAT